MSSAAADAEEALRHLRAIAAEPRPAGGDAESRAREYCRRVLLSAGYAIEEAPFAYSSAPGRWATPLAGALSAASVVAAAMLGSRGSSGGALALLVAVLAVVGAGGSWLGRRGVLALPIARRTSVNLVATRGAPTVWLMAHLDSKSQPVPILVRASGITLGALVWLAAAGLAAGQATAALGSPNETLWRWLAGAAVAANLPVMASVVGARSAGALDNASGVATVLLAATRLTPAHAVGVLLTSAEELGLAGARAWAQGRPAGTVLNCDGVDDAGATTVMYAGRRPEPLLRAIGRGARRAGLRVRWRRLLPGILTDGVALSDAGWAAVTFSRGGAATLARIHTPADDVTRLTGAGAAEVARVLVETVEELA